MREVWIRMSITFNSGIYREFELDYPLVPLDAERDLARAYLYQSEIAFCWIVLNVFHNPRVDEPDNLLTRGTFLHGITVLCMHLVNPYAFMFSLRCIISLVLIRSFTDPGLYLPVIGFLTSLKHYILTNRNNIFMEYSVLDSPIARFSHPRSCSTFWYRNLRLEPLGNEKAFLESNSQYLGLFWCLFFNPLDELNATTSRWYCSERKRTQDILSISIILYGSYNQFE